MSFAARATAAIALAGLMLVACFAPLLHLVLVPHVTCAAHGELVHGGGDEAPVPDEASVTTARSGDSHEHCLSLSAQRSAVVSPAAQLASRLAHATVALGTELPAAPSLEALELAPKASPPV